MSQNKNEMALCIELVKKASDITEWFRNKKFKPLKKIDRSPVSVADFASQIFIINGIKENFPNDQIFAEESEDNLIDNTSESQIKECFKELGIEGISDFKKELNYRGVKSDRQWTIDPIDGTAGYIEGLTYAIGITHMVNSDPRLCAISVPDYNKKGLAIFIAEKDNGAQASYGGDTFQPIHVSNQNKITKARLCQSLHYDLPWVTQFADKIGIEERITLDSMSKFCMIADGSYDLYVKPTFGKEMSSWDYSPGDLLVKEAGGKVTDLDEEPLKFKEDKCYLASFGIIVSNRILHDEVAVFIRNNFFSV
ncbi:MAG: inositol monophosphatase family protein [Candidatus Hermodarchaeota archaeon]